MRKVLIYILMLSTVLAFALLFNNYIRVPAANEGSISQEVTFPNVRTIGIWLWTSPDELSIERIGDELSYLEAEKINKVFLNIEKYVDIVEGEESTKQQNVNDFEESLKRFISIANSHNIEVEALAGAPIWVEPSHEYIPFLLSEYVIDFNQNNPETTFSGIQFDIEYYNLDGYSSNINGYSDKYLNLVARLSQEVSIYSESSDFSFGFAIPFWFDQENGGNIFPKLAEILSTNKNGYLAIMSYRNYLTGGEGTIDISKDELSYLKNNNLDLKILIGQETDNVEPKKITYDGMTKSDLKRDTSTIAEYFSDNESFGGFAIHHWDSYINLPN